MSYIRALKIRRNIYLAAACGKGANLIPCSRLHGLGWPCARPQWANSEMGSLKE